MSKSLNINNPNISNLDLIHQDIQETLKEIKDKIGYGVDALIWFYSYHPTLQDTPRNLVIKGNLKAVLSQLEVDYPS